MYTYEAKVISVYDGDTITVDIDLGFGVWLRNQKLRLYGINTPEVRSKSKEEKAAGYAARDALRALILDRVVMMESLGKGKYGRWVSKIFLNDDSKLYINEWLVSEGHAVKKNY